MDRRLLIGGCAALLLVIGGLVAALVLTGDPEPNRETLLAQFWEDHERSAREPTFGIEGTQGREYQVVDATTRRFRTLNVRGEVLYTDRVVKVEIKRWKGRVFSTRTEGGPDGNGETAEFSDIYLWNDSEGAWTKKRH